MSHEAEMAARMIADAPLMALLAGGVYESATVGDSGITRKSAPDAFDADGFLKPCALVKQRETVPDGQFDDEDEPAESVVQIVEIWFYQNSGYETIDAAARRTYRLFKGYALSDSFPMRLALVVERGRDGGPLKGRPLLRQDWQVNSIVHATHV